MRQTLHIAGLSIASLLTAAHAADVGTFQDPGAILRPKFRYWLPDASVDAQVVQENILSAGNIGAGGVEFLPFYNYGDELPIGGPGPNWTTYGFGTPAFADLFVAALKAHQEQDLVMDFAQGPSQGQGVPAPTDNDGLQWDLAPFSVSMSSNGSFNGVIPGWGTGTLVSLVSAEVVSSENSSVVTDAHGVTVSTDTPYTILTLRNGSLVNHADSVGTNGGVQIQRSAGANYTLFAFYEYRTLNKNLEYSQSPAVSIFDNGSYIVDHFSARGAQTIMEFWEKHLINEEVQQLLDKVGVYGWEDSFEGTCNITWSPSLPELFSETYGYNLQTVLPLVMFGNNNIGIQYATPGSIKCVLDTPDAGLGVVNDYRGALMLGYRHYLQGMTEWLNTRLGLGSSAQVSYNLPIDMAANVPFVDAPECESLGFNSSVDAYRQFVGPATLGGRHIISNEMGAVEFEAYRYPIPHLLWSIHRALAAGVNRFVLHGQDYTGEYYRTTWPGYTGFCYLFSGQYSHKDPAWSRGLDDALEYVARLQFNQQRGQLRTDVAIYNKDSATDPFLPTIYTSTDLEDSGYSYNYVSPDNFALPLATVRKGIFGPDGPGYRALVIPNTTYISPDVIRTVQGYAEQGLPIILSGGNPGLYFSAAPGSSPAEFEAALAALNGTANVYHTTAGGAAEKLQALGLRPTVEVDSNGTWYPIWRENTDGSGEGTSCFIFNDADALTNGTIDVATTGTPYVLDAWTGRQIPLLLYETVGGRTRIPLTLQANQSVLLGFDDGNSAASALHATKLPSAVLGYDYKSSKSINLHVAAGAWDSAVQLSDGRTYASSDVKSAASASSLTGWELEVEHWEAPANLSDASVVAVKSNTTLSLQSLVSWTEIPALTNVSGVGFYTVQFTWPPAGNTSADGAYIRLPRIVHAARLYVNGQELPALDPTFPQVDISAYLQPGKQNQLQIEAPTMMWNYLRSFLGDITFMGLPGNYLLDAVDVMPGLVDNGIIGDVELVPYTILEV